MENEIKLLGEPTESHKYYTDLEWIEEFYDFLQGVIPEEIILKRGHSPKISAKKAFTIIWYLQEHFQILPSTIERCDHCGSLFDIQSEGIHWESKKKNYCSGCDYLVPSNYDNNKNG